MFQNTLKPIFGLKYISKNFPDNLTASSLGIQAEVDESFMDRAPFMLQKKMMHILSKFKR